MKTNKINNNKSKRCGRGLGEVRTRLEYSTEQTEMKRTEEEEGTDTLAESSSKYYSGKILFDVEGNHFSPHMDNNLSNSSKCRRHDDSRSLTTTSFNLITIHIPIIATPRTEILHQYSKINVSPT